VPPGSSFEFGRWQPHRRRVRRRGDLAQRSRRKAVPTICIASVARSRQCRFGIASAAARTLDGPAVCGSFERGRCFTLRASRRISSAAPSCIPAWRARRGPQARASPRASSARGHAGADYAPAGTRSRLRSSSHAAAVIHLTLREPSRRETLSSSADYVQLDRDASSIDGIETSSTIAPIPQRAYRAVERLRQPRLCCPGQARRMIQRTRLDSRSRGRCCAPAPCSG